MTRSAKIGAAIAAVAVYTLFGVRGWLGICASETPDPDGKYVASIYTHSPLLLPFVKTYDVQLPSQGDLNSHVVFRTSGIRKSINAKWLDRSNLVIVCRHCEEDELVAKQIDSIQIHLVRE